MPVRAYTVAGADAAISAAVSPLSGRIDAVSSGVDEVRGKVTALEGAPQVVVLDDGADVPEGTSEDAVVIRVQG